MRQQPQAIHPAHAFAKPREIVVQPRVLGTPQLEHQPDLRCSFVPAATHAASPAGAEDLSRCSPITDLA